jgi:hypothetical protein
MNVGELKEMLDKYPDELELIVDRYRYYSSVEEGDWSVVKAVPTYYGFMRSHPTMSEENKKNEKEYLHLS